MNLIYTSQDIQKTVPIVPIVQYIDKFIKINSLYYKYYWNR